MNIACARLPPDLEGCAGQHQSYKRAANLVEAVHQLMEHFQQYEDVEKVRRAGCAGVC